MRKITVIYLFALVTLTFGSCTETENILLSHDRKILMYFTKEEAEELQFIHDFFIDHICLAGDVNQGDGASCLTQFLQKKQN